MSAKPLAIDLFCGLGGWTEGLLAEGWEVNGVDIERHEYGEHIYPAKLILADVLTLHGSQFKDADLIVASPPCQEYSYMAMPWSRAKALAADYRSGKRDVKQLTALFDACFRIQREACEAAGRHIPLIVENVRGAIPWVGRSRWNFGSYHLWGDVPALMPSTLKQSGVKAPGMNWSDQTKRGQDFTRIAGQHADGQKVPGFRFDGSGRSFQTASVKTVGHPNKRDGRPHTRHLTNPAEHSGVKQPGISGRCANGKGDAWFQDGVARSGSKSPARKMASAMIAKIPLPLARHIAATFKPAAAGRR